MVGGAIEIRLSEKGALAKKRLGNTGLHYLLFRVCIKTVNVIGCKVELPPTLDGGM